MVSAERDRGPGTLWSRRWSSNVWGAVSFVDLPDKLRIFCFVSLRRGFSVGMQAVMNPMSCSKLE